MSRLIRVIATGLVMVLVAVAGALALARYAPYYGKVLCNVPPESTSLRPGRYFLSLPGYDLAHMDAIPNTNPTSRLISPNYRWITRDLDGAADGFGEVYVADYAKLDWEQLTRTSALEWVLAWSPDSRRILYQLDNPEDPVQNGLYAVDIVSRQIVLIHLTRESIALAQWSPDGRHIAYTTTDNYHFLLDTETGTARPLDNYGRLNNWSPDGQHILFTGTGNLNPIGQLASYNIRTGELTPLNAGRNAEGGMWLEDQRFVVFQSGGDAFLMNLETEETMSLYPELERYPCGPITWRGYRHYTY